MNVITLLLFALSSILPEPATPLATDPPVDSEPYIRPEPGLVRPWDFPGEVSLPSAYDRLYGTRFDDGARSGLLALRKARAASMPEAWNIDLVRAVRLIADDTGSVRPILVELADGRRLELIAALPWTPPSRGYLPLGERTIALEPFLRAHGVDPDSAEFHFVIGDVPVDAGNALLLDGGRRGEALLGYNEAGVEGGDADCNEPILQLFSWAADARI